MQCRKIKKWIPLYITQDLEPDETIQMGEHLQACSKCRKEVDIYQLLRSQYVGLEDVHSDNIQDKAFFQDVWSQVSFSKKINRSIALRPLLISMAVVLVSLSSWTIWQRVTSRSLTSYLVEEDYQGLYDAFQNPSQQNRLLNEQVSAKLLKRTIERCDSRMLMFGLPKMIASVNQKNNSKDLNVLQELKALNQIDRMPSKVTLNQVFEWTHSKNAI